METLDKCFKDVCELDLIFHVTKVIFLFHSYFPFPFLFFFLPPLFFLSPFLPSPLFYLFFFFITFYLRWNFLSKFILFYIFISLPLKNSSSPSLPSSFPPSPLSLSIQVHYILEEIVMGGLVLETGLPEVMSHIEAQNSVVKGEQPLAGIQNLVGNLKR